MRIRHLVAAGTVITALMVTVLSGPMAQADPAAPTTSTTPPASPTTDIGPTTTTSGVSETIGVDITGISTPPPASGDGISGTSTAGTSPAGTSGRSGALSQTGAPIDRMLVTGLILIISGLALRIAGRRPRTRFR
ncbi:MAG TPA: hypothetical protein VGJ13_08840 [Pseudonocardiaceae bacterium]|jgi:hypothetical protein